MSSHSNLDARKAAVLDRLDIQAEYASLGIRWASANGNGRATPKGWLKCYLLGQEDNNPSGGVCIDGKDKGDYKNWTTGEKISIFDAAQRFGGQADFMSALRHYEQRLGITPDDDSSDPASRLAFIPWSKTLAAQFCRIRPPITAEALQLAGARLAMWPKRAPANAQQFVMALPIYRAIPPDNPCGWVVLPITPTLKVYRRGEEDKPKTVKVYTIIGSQSGFVGRHGLDCLLDAELVWKVEGITDMLALQSVIPDDMRMRHVVITNAMGAGEWPDKAWSCLLDGKDARLIHDADVPGENGATHWAGIGSSIKQARLPYKVTIKHGKDLRDFLGKDGKTYADVLSLPLSDISVPVQPDELLVKLQLDILGEDDDGKIEIYSSFHRKISRVSMIQNLGYPTLLQIAGAPARDFVHDPAKGDEPAAGRAALSEVRNRIALEAGLRRIDAGNQCGQGIWQAHDGTLLIVNGAGASVWDGEKLTDVDTPKYGPHVLNFSGGKGWADKGALQAALEASADQEWCKGVFNELMAVLRQWHWEREKDAGLCAAFILCTWVQHVWHWRGQVAFVSPASTGKSTLLNFMAGLFGGLAWKSAHPSEASIRQHVNNRMCAVLIEEFERTKHRDEVLNLVRTAGLGEKISRGTRDQRGREFGLKHHLWFATTDLLLSDETDVSRFVIFGLKRFLANSHGKYKLPDKDGQAALGIKLCAIAIRHVAKASELAVKMYGHQFDGFTGRMIENHAGPAAMAALATGDDPLQLLEYFLGRAGDDPTKEVVPKEEELLTAILHSQVDVGGKNKMSVAEILSNAAYRREHADAMARVGLSIASDHRGPRNFDAMPKVLFIVPSQVSRFLLQYSRWKDADVKQLLLRLKGAKVQQRTVNGLRPLGVDCLLEGWMGEEGEEGGEIELPTEGEGNV